MRVEPLTDTSFAAFGALIRHPGGSERHYLPAVLATPLPDARPALWIHPVKPAQWPLRIDKLERHPHGAQSFMPLGSGHALVVVCGKDAEGMPDPKALRAFLCPPATGFTYHPGVWHHGLTSIDAAIDFVVVMAAHGVTGETDWFSLPTAITIEHRDLP
ncbi:ureidoglycolate lyase [Kaistia soli DSM 19436]|uniref:Ureidoglycolate lyase n=1 Tax=Kaistia soli DSM 19436 TaxID=1122133 RepID=A0A1M5GA03_9HYPH|nr:ureidoglycolate lyase [Kaistia soli]SHG00597.1 ureidoglycolate lyase [Kaistia soli DSM 19436]